MRPGDAGRAAFAFRIFIGCGYGCTYAMLKSLYSRHNDVFLDMLRSRRKAMHLRQRDVAKLVGRGQATVSKVEGGSRRLDVIELRTWLVALQIDFVTFVNELEQRLKTNTASEIQLLRRIADEPSSAGVSKTDLEPTPEGAADSFL